ncbi:MAG: DUF3071 domain-containing protein [Actinobacteria bacterium HGW-Actinobacteria-4]|nr:MAG: DUF3071 domain-containing protein [Actinobacteria bacterium HGW-Actinobacteria-4]
MTSVTLVGPSDDGQHVVVATAAGEQFLLPITEELRLAVRHARVAVQARADAHTDAPSMSPKEIQRRIRSGLNARELAELSHMPLALLEKYEAPVLAERSYITELARATRVGRDNGSPLLGDLVTDRLAGRRADLDTLAWDAWRVEGEPWQVCVDFTIDGRTSRALWTFDHTVRSLTAQDDEARWLTETELLDVPIPQRHLTSVRAGEAASATVRPLRESRPASPGGAAEPEAPSPTEALLNDLASRRGTREAIPIDESDDDDPGFEGFGPAAKAREAEVGFGAPGPQSMPHPAGSGRDQSPRDEPIEPPTPTVGQKRPAKKGRASVPSWDEIVFGAKND